jgi:hypothetical protein
MVTTKTIFSLTIPKWENKVKMGVVIATYYKKRDKLPAKHKGAKLKKFGRSFIYVDNKNKKIIKNPTKVGNPIYWNLNGQQFYSTNIHWSVRSTIVNYYHRYFNKYIKKAFSEPFPTFLSYRLAMDITIYEIYSSHTPDITNMWILAKLFEDAMVGAKILRDDDPQFRCSTSYSYKFVNDEKDRKLKIKFKYIKL